jgi:multidrug transporter EmrE-like cation transporter
VPSICDLEDLPSSEACGHAAASCAAVEKRYPTKREVLAAIPEECFERSLLKSSVYLFLSLAMTIGSGALAYACIPLTWSWTPAWIAYAIVAGTAATGCWSSPTSVVIARLRSTIGFRT